MAISNKISDAIFGGRSQAFLSDGIRDFLFDSVIDFTINDSFNVTSHAVEEGIGITDNVDSNPQTVSISAILTDNDFDLLDPTEFFDATIEERFDVLDVWRTEATILTYYGHETDIENVVITDFSRNKNPDVGEGWSVEVSLREIEVATYQKQAISLSEATSKGVTSKGKASKAGNATSGKSKSILSRLSG